MSRLNAMIKLVVMTGEAIFLFVALTVMVIAALVSSGRIMALDFPEVRRIAIVTLIVSTILLCSTIYGCCGIVNQIVRKGCWCRGRRVLCCHQIILLAVLVLSVIEYDELSNREKSINVVIGNVTAYPTYDSFERKLDKYFSNAYFEGNCVLIEDSQTSTTYDRSSEWLMEWVDTYCPVTMRREKCYLSNEKKGTCDTYCPEKIWNAETCCPSEEWCFDKGLKESCPYDQCRVSILKYIRGFIVPALSGLRFISVLTLIMIFLTCLLICYNPRDDIEIELLKTGVMTEEDVETIRKLKSHRSFSYEKGNNKGRQKSIDLDTILETRSQASRNSSILTQASRRSFGLLNQSNNRVHPFQSSSQ